MRLSVVLVLSIGAAAGGCGSHSLTGDMTGTGGAGTGGEGTGTGGTGGSSNLGTGGTGGAAVAACLDLAAQYQQAVPAAMACDVGGTDQCLHSVDSALSVCGSCPVDVSDPTTLNAIRQLWDAANCLVVLPKLPCAAVFCPAASNGVCAPADGGTRGVCSNVPGAGACDALAQKYATTLAALKSCTVGAAGQCAHAVAARLSPCRDGCVQYVNDTSPLDSIQQAWVQQGCASVAVACPDYVCAPAAGGVCAASDGGSGTCAIASFAAAASN